MLLHYTCSRITDALLSAVRLPTTTRVPQPRQTPVVPITLPTQPAEATIPLASTSGNVASPTLFALTRRDMLALGISYAYAFSLIGLAEGVRKWRGYPQDFTRKIVHVGAGMWVFGVLALFETWYAGVALFGSFVVLNYLFYRRRLFEAMDEADSTPGTVYFAFSIMVLFLAFWRTNSAHDRCYIAAGGAMAMTWGDALASLIGRRWGRHRYTIGGSTRSWEGSAAMFLASSLTIFATLRSMPGSRFAPQAAPLPLDAALAAALVSALVATTAEAVSPAGTDNLSVPLLAGAMIAATTRTRSHRHTLPPPL
jgi:dolichol kinase